MNIYELQLKIALAAEFAERLREKVREKTQFYCSAGVGNNKVSKGEEEEEEGGGEGILIRGRFRRWPNSCVLHTNHASSRSFHQVS